MTGAPAQSLTSISASQLARMVRTKQTSALEVVDAHVQRIASVNPKLNAVVQLAPDARDRARAADDALARGDSVGPLHGVPFTVKDWLETSDLICAAGFDERRAYVPKRDATVVARMRAAGAILLGKTNVNDGAPVYARPANPYDIHRSPGASSSGEAAIIAAGGSPIGLGSDSGGSIRLPSAWCGVAGLKPTTGLVPSTGHFPRLAPMSDPRTAIGPIARHVEDLALALSILARPDGRDAGVVPVRFGDPSSVDVKGLRVARYAETPGVSPAAAVVDAVDAAAAALAARGARIVAATPPRLDEAMPITVAYWSRASSVSLSEWMPTKPSTLSADEIERSVFEWERFSADMLRFMDAYDLILCPAAQDAAPPHRPLTAADFAYTLPYSLTRYPAAVVRAGTSPDGLPVGVQIVAPAWHDHVALAAAAELERALGPWPAPAI
jgi:amidase